MKKWFKFLHRTKHRKGKPYQKYQISVVFEFTIFFKFMRPYIHARASWHLHIILKPLWYRFSSNKHPRRWRALIAGGAYWRLLHYTLWNRKLGKMTTIKKVGVHFDIILMDHSEFSKLITKNTNKMKHRSKYFVEEFRTYFTGKSISHFTKI